MALLVQRQAGIDSDLVAALQFESAHAAGWGSVQLETAVIDRVAAGQGTLNVMAAMPRQPLARRRNWLLATAAVWLLLGVAAPMSVRVFFQRLAFGPQHYPTRTRLEAVLVNGKEIDFTASDKRPLHVACDQPVHFEVAIAGSRPEGPGDHGYMAAGAPRVEISARDGGPAATVRLEAESGERGAGSHPEGTRQESPGSLLPAPCSLLYRGTLLKLSQAARYQVFAGDAWTDPLDLSVTPLPIVEVEVVVVAPDYALRSTGRVVKLARGMRDFSVLAGSEVKLRLDCDRPIQAAEVTAAGPGVSGTPSFAMRREDGPVGGAETWTLATSGTPLAAIVAPLRYAIQIHDMEGQTFERPLEGSINLKPDLPPTIAAKTRTPIVLATGTPNIHYDAADEHAFSKVWLTWEANYDEVSPSAEARQAGKPEVLQAGDAADHESAAVKRQGRIDLCHFTPDAAPRAGGRFPPGPPIARAQAR